MRDSYYHLRYPKGVQSRYTLLVFDPNNKVFLPLTDFYDDASREISESSALSYLQCLLPFFTWLDKHSNYQGKLVQRLILAEQYIAENNEAWVAKQFEQFQ